MNTTTSSGSTLFTELMQHPEKLEAALKAAKEENDAFAASRVFGRNDAGHARQNGAFKDGGVRKSVNAGFMELSD